MSGTRHAALERRAPGLPQGAIKRYDAGARRIERIVILAITVVPSIGAAAGLWLLATGELHVVDHAIFAGMYLLTGFGITIGYHRLLAHRAFRTGPAMRGILAAAGAMAIQGPAMRWVADHRRHHGWADRPGDPHSPRLGSRAAGPSARGLWHAHLGWFFDDDKTAVRTFAADLVRDPVVARVDRLYPLWMLLSLAVPTALGFAAGGTAGAYHALVWGGLTRVFVVQHVTWSVNSIGHAFGSRRFDTPDDSRNNRLLGWLALGEGWHNNHHAFPRSAIHGLRRSEVDASGLLLRGLERLRLVWDLHHPRV
ncbi:MAG: acyl-CoA desaturase [Thermodesulfobacteriota bacterium]